MSLTPGESPIPERIAPGPGQESVWDYPRPPRVEPVPERLRVMVRGAVLADTAHGLRVLETAGPPVYYFPRADVRMERLVESPRTTHCEWKGTASYWTYDDGTGLAIHNIAWSYEDPLPGYEAIRAHLAFYAGLVDEAWVGGERATPQPGRFYGGWVTSRIVGPFKGEPGSSGW